MFMLFQMICFILILILFNLNYKMKELKTNNIEVNVFNDSNYTSQAVTARSTKNLKIIKFTGDMK